MYPHRGFWYRGTFESTLVPVFGSSRGKLRIWTYVTDSGFCGPGIPSCATVALWGRATPFLDHFPKYLSSALARTELCHEVRNPRLQKPQIIRNEDHLALFDRCRGTSYKTTLLETTLSCEPPKLNNLRSTPSCGSLKKKYFQGGTSAERSWHEMFFVELRFSYKKCSEIVPEKFESLFSKCQENPTHFPVKVQIVL